MHRSTCILGPAVSKFLAEFQYDSSSLEFIQKQWFCALAFMLAMPLCLHRSKVSLRYFSHLKKRAFKHDVEDTRLTEPLSVCCAHATVLLAKQDLSFIQW